VSSAWPIRADLMGGDLRHWGPAFAGMTEKAGDAPPSGNLGQEGLAFVTI
jgi:hypothetical protein